VDEYTTSLPTCGAQLVQVVGTHPSKQGHLLSSGYYVLHVVWQHPGRHPNQHTGQLMGLLGRIRGQAAAQPGCQPGQHRHAGARHPLLHACVKQVRRSLHSPTCSCYVLGCCMPCGVQSLDSYWGAWLVCGHSC
jgi:hypothetical protein